MLDPFLKTICGFWLLCFQLGLMLGNFLVSVCWRFFTLSLLCFSRLDCDDIVNTGHVRGNKTPNPGWYLFKNTVDGTFKNEYCAFETGKGRFWIFWLTNILLIQHESGNRYHTKCPPILLTANDFQMWAANLKKNKNCFNFRNMLPYAFLSLMHFHDSIIIRSGSVSF